MVDEIWLPVDGYEGFYEVSCMGNVRGIDRWVEVNGGIKFVPGTIMSPEKNKRDGHLRVQLTRNGSRKKFMVHRLVLFAFVGPPPEGMEALHDNGIPDDNRLSNLRWGTKSENAEDSIKHGTHHLASKTHCVRGHLLDGNNLVSSKLLKYGKRICLSCSRARALLVHRGDLSDESLKRLSDEYFIKLEMEMV